MGRCARGPRTLCFKPSAGCTAAGDTPALQACLRALNSSEVAAAARGLPTEDLLCDWSPVIDGVELTAHPQVLAEQGKVHAVPTLLGTNQDEGTEFVHLALNASEADFEAYAEQNAPGYGAAIAAQYPVSAYKKTTYASAAWWAATHFLGDSQMSNRRFR